MNGLLPVVLPSVLLIAAMGFLSRVGTGCAIGREVQRKTLHISVGLAALSFPLFLDEWWEIVSALALAVAWFFAVRRIAGLRSRFGPVLHGVKRQTLGEIYFALSIGVLLLLAHDEPILFVVPVMILALADAFAAIVGKVFPKGPMTGIAKGKTLAGCGTFFAIALLVSCGMLVLLGNVPLAHALTVAAVLAATTCCAEAVSRRGMDNLVVPAAAYLILLFSGIPDEAGSQSIRQLQADLTTLMASR